MTPLDRITDGTFPIQGLPTIRATGITVGTILSLVASGKNAAEIVAVYPSLEVDDVQAALEFLRLFLSRGPATKAAMTLGMPRRDLIAVLKMVDIQRPLTRSSATSQTIVVQPTPRTRNHIEALFSPSERSAAEELLANLFPLSSPNDSERVHCAALRLSRGDLAELASVVQEDWRDILVSAGFGSDSHAHETWVPRCLTSEVASGWENGGQIDGVLFRRGEPAKLYRRGGVVGEPCVVLSLVALEPEVTYTVRTGRPGPDETLSALQSWLHPLANRALNPTGLRPAG